jgi:hypothetical protein
MKCTKPLYSNPELSYVLGHYIGAFEGMWGNNKRQVNVNVNITLTTDNKSRLRDIWK